MVGTEARMISGRRIFPWTMQLSSLLGQIVDTPEPTACYHHTPPTPLMRLPNQLGETLPSSLASRQDPSCLIVPLLQGSISLEVVPTHPATRKVSKGVGWLSFGFKMDRSRSWFKS